MARLDHAGVVRIYSMGEHEGDSCICMEFLQGGSLRDRLRQDRLAIREAAELVRQLALAVQHAHENQVLHRDLKPGNVLLTADGSPKVSDFGLAKLLDLNDDLTQTGAVMGTPAYMAPEQAEGRLSDIRERTDVWAFGAILYECLTGRPPFQSQSRSETLELVKKCALAAVRRFRSETPPELEAICRKCLEKQPVRRHVRGGVGERFARLARWQTHSPSPDPEGDGAGSSRPSPSFCSWAWERGALCFFGVPNPNALPIILQRHRAASPRCLAPAPFARTHRALAGPIGRRIAARCISPTRGT